jgi:hypothetical protein
MRIKFVRVSGNEKTGPIPVTYTSRDTCPDACAFKGKGKGCYAEAVRTKGPWDDAEANGLDMADFLAQIRALPKGQLWRHNVAGDLPGENNRLDGKGLAKIVAANRGRRGFTYTHKPLTRATVRHLRAACDGGFVVNVSADTLREADEKASTGLPTVVVLPMDAPRHLKTPEGRHVIVCPAQEREDVSCASCGICAVGTRKAIVGFRAHGIWAKQIHRRLTVVQ